MSRAHDGQKSYHFPFGNPFRAILPKGSHLSPKLQLLLTSFEEGLALSLRKLKPENGADCLTLSWMRQAIDCLSVFHTNIATLITELQFPISDWDEKWVDIYLDSSVKLLDICIALSSELSRLDQGHLLLQFVVHVLDTSSDAPSTEQLKRAQASLQDWIKQASTRSARLESCSTILKELAGSLCFMTVKDSAKGKVLMRALYGVKVVTVFISSVLVASLLGSSKPLMESQMSEKFLWSEAFNDIQLVLTDELRKRLSSGNNIKVKELEEVECHVTKLDVLTGADRSEETAKHPNGISHEEDVIITDTSTDEERTKELLDCISNLAGSAERLQMGLDSLSKQVDNFFKILITGRDALLSNLRISDVSGVTEIKS